jgi:hypothetical protein
MVMTCDNNPLMASNVTISESKVSNPDTIPSFHAVVSVAYADDNTLVYGYNAEESAQYFTRVEPGVLLEPFTAVIKSTSKRVRSHRSTSAQNKNYMALALAIEESSKVYEMLHLQIEEEWNVLLLDAINHASSLFSSTQGGTEEMQSCASQLLELVNRYRLKKRHVVDPICYSSLLVNPSFELRSKEGWEAGSNTQLVISTNLNNFAVGMDGGYLLYGGMGEGNSDISQTVDGQRGRVVKADGFLHYSKPACAPVR